jgi:hypothetical protein
MSIDLPKEEDKDITIHKPSNNNVTNEKLSKQDIRSKRKNRLVF